MATKRKLNDAFEKAAKQLLALGRIGPTMTKWEWDDTRETAWRVLRNEVLPEFGIGEPKKEEEKAMPKITKRLSPCFR